MIRYTAGHCELGTMLLGATERGVCALAFGDDVAELAGWLRSEFPAEAVERRDAELADRLDAAIRCLSDARPEPLPLDLRGTPFQARVWDELRRIPRGETATYAELAERIGSPTAIRAAATACAANRVALLVPCHRAVGADGRLRGYRWGLWRKRALLRREGGDPSLPLFNDDLERAGREECVVG